MSARTTGAGARGAHNNAISSASRRVGLLEFHQLNEMVASGRAAARELLEPTGGDLHGGFAER